MGGIISICIVICSTSIEIESINNASDLAKAIEPLYGLWAKYILAIGLFSAGLTSAVTAPLAAAYVAAGCLGWSSEMKSLKFRTVWISILLIGVISSSSGFKSIEIIKFAQITNGILLPIIAVFLIWIANKKSILGKFKNNLLNNFAAILILLVTLVLTIKSIITLL